MSLILIYNNNLGCLINNYQNNTVVTTNINDNTWRHFVWVINGKSLIFYLDGIQVNKIDNTINFNNVLSNDYVNNIKYKF